jgi:hypothetical protein
VHAWRAVLRVTGSAGRFEEFRERIRWLLVRDPDAESYTEHHAPGQLEYRFEIRKGIPFPAFAAATSEFPELRVEAEWRNELQASAGRAVIEHGRLVEQHTETIESREALGVDVAVSVGGELQLAFVLRQEGGTAIGYAASAGQQTYFRFEGGRLELIEPDPGLEDLAFDFAGRWLWYDESPPEESAIERARYAEYGYPVRGANVKSAQLARMRGAGGAPGGGLRFSNLDDEGLKVRAALLSDWLGRGEKA